MTDLPATIRDIVERSEADRHALFKTYNDLRRQARDSEDPQLHTLVAEAYRAFLRAHLDPGERALLEAEDEIVRLRADLAKLRGGKATTRGAA